MNKKQKKNQLPKFVSLTGVAFQMGITIYLSAFFGKKLDESYPNEKNYFTILLTLVGVAVSLYITIKQLNNLNKN